VTESKRSGQSKYVPNLTFGARVLLLKKDHRNSGATGTIIAVLINPSKRAEHQWYDVRFDNGILGRFREADLEYATS
jgi:hypothetical protein